MRNYTKSTLAPACLAIEAAKPNGDYRCPGVAIQVKNDFSNRCYLTEENLPTNINVEHFRPHQNVNLALKFDWNNLYYASAHANMIKSDDYNTHPANEILDPIDNLNKVTIWIEYYIDIINATISFEAKIPLNHVSSIRVNNSIELLNAIFRGLRFNHNYSTEQRQIQAENLRKRVAIQVSDFMICLNRYLLNNNPSDEQLLKVYIDKMNENTGFTAFKIWKIKNHAPNPEQLLQTLLGQNEYDTYFA